MPSSQIRLTSLQNDQVKNLVRLRTRRERDRQQLVLIEESLVIRRALAADYPMSVVYFCPELLTETQRPLLRDLEQLVAGRPDAQLVEMTVPIMTKVSYRDKPEGLLVLAPQQRRTLADLKLDGTRAPLLVVLESVEKPGNLGAILRTADGAGADAVIVCGEGTDLFNPNVLRASRGAFFTVPTVAATPAELFGFLAKNGVRTIATSPAATAGWDQTDLTAPTAVLLGAEHDGLSPDFMAHAQTVVSIPMQGSGDSLNVATAAAVILYEAVRQRRATV